MIITKNQKIVISILIIILLGLCVYYFISQTKSPPVSPPMTDEQRLELLQKPSDIPPANPNMTDEERLKLLNQPSKIPPLSTINVKQ